MTNPSLIFVLCALVAGISLLLCILAFPIGTSLRVLDIPDERKVHRNVTPLMGGITLCLAVLPIWIGFYAESGIEYAKMVLIAAAVGVVSVLGILDDRHAVRPMTRIIVSTLVFIGLAIWLPDFNIRILDFQLFHFRIGLGSFPTAVFFTVLCCVGLLNAINMADGKNGLVISLCLGWLALLMMRAPVAMMPAIVFTMVSLAVLLFFNLRGSLFLGDGGSYGYGCAIALITIMTYNQPGTHALRAISADEIVLMFIVPVMDAFRLSYSRIRAGRSPMSADRNHLHHHLQNRFGWPGGLFIYLVLALAPATVVFLA